MGIILPVVSLFIAFLGGLGLLSLLVRSKKSGLDTCRACGTAMILGAGLVSFLSYWLGLVVQGAWLRCIVAGICLAMAAYACRLHPPPALRRPQLTAPGSASFTIAGLQTAFLTWFSLYRTSLDWDGLFNWESKARIAFLYHGAVPLSYYTNHYDFFHRRYPPLIPMLEAWIYGFAGRMDQGALKLVGPYFYLAAVLLVLSTARRNGVFRWSSVVVTIPFLLVPSLLFGSGSASSGYADFPLSVVYLCAVVHCLEYWRTGSADAARLVGVTAMLLPFTKADGLVPLLCIAIAVAPLIVRERNWKLGAWMLAPGFGIFLAWAIFMRLLGVPREGDFLELTPYNFLIHVDQAKGLPVWTLQELTTWTRWGLLWPIALAAVAWLVWQRRPLRWYPWAATVVGPLVLFPCVYFFSAWNPIEAHVKSSIPRLFIQVASAAALLAGVALAEVFDGAKVFHDAKALPASSRSRPRSPLPGNIESGLTIQITPWLVADVLTIASIFILNVYRAVRQSVVHDEALTYLGFVSRPWRESLTSYDANNHVLHTILAKLTCNLLGPSQLALRLPSLLAGLFFLIVALRLCKTLASSEGLAFVAFLSLALNPLILDYLSLARGYSLALALFSYSALIALRLVSGEKPRARQFVAFGAALALSVTANLTFLFPSVGIFLALALLAGLGWWRAEVSARRIWLDLVRYAAIPAAAIAVPILYPPLSRATSGAFYFGSKTFMSSIVSAVGGSINYGSDTLLTPLVYVILAILVAASATSFVLLVRRKRGSEFQQPHALFLVVQWSVNSTILLLVAAHGLFGVLYPPERTGLYLVFCFTLACLSLAGLMPQPGRKHWTPLATVAFLLLLVPFTSRLSLTYYATWRYDANTRRAFDTVRIMALAHPERKSRVGCTWLYAPALEFYRRVNEVQNIEPVQYAVPTPLSGHDFYVVAGGDRAAARAAGLVEVTHYDLSDTTVLVSPPKP